MHVCVHYDGIGIAHLRKSNSFPDVSKCINNSTGSMLGSTINTHPNVTWHVYLDMVERKFHSWENNTTIKLLVAQQYPSSRACETNKLKYNSWCQSYRDENIIYILPRRILFQRKLTWIIEILHLKDPHQWSLVT